MSQEVVAFSQEAADLGGGGGGRKKQTENGDRGFLGPG